MPHHNWLRRRPLIINPQTKVPQRAKKFRIGAMLWRALKRTCTALGALVLISTIISITLTSMLFSQRIEPLPEKMVLVLRLDQGLVESNTGGGFADLPGILNPGTPTVRDIVDSIEQAAQDQRVKGVVFSMKSGSYALAHAEEVRSAIQRLQESGKFAYAYAPTFGRYGSALSQYYLASAFDQVWMQPVGSLSITGLNAEMPFAREALGDLGIEPHFFKREDHKTAAESVTRRSMSPENREMTQRLLGNMADQMITGIAQARDLERDTVRDLVDKGLLTGKEADTNGLIDKLDYSDRLVEHVRERVTGNRDDKSLKFVPLGSYAGRIHGDMPDVVPGAVDQDTKRVALVSMNGTIVQQAPVSGPGARGDIVSAETVHNALHEAAENDAISAIVLRINSPGGSPTASETIRRGIEYAQQEDKKVIVSLGPVAASGGYWVASAADQVFASEGTITGSIGVVGGKFDLSGLWDKLNVNWDHVSVGDNAGLWSFNRGFGERGSQRFEAMIDDVYNQFLRRVAEGRDMPLEQVRDIAGGRVWTGASAVNNGLVDKEGGLSSAMDYTAKQLGLASRRSLQVVELPRQKSSVELVLDMLRQQARVGGLVSQLAPLVNSAAPVVEQVQNPERSLTRMPVNIH